jgi:hypothetical protein
VGGIDEKLRIVAVAIQTCGQLIGQFLVRVRELAEPLAAAAIRLHLDEDAQRVDNPNRRGGADQGAAG